jgi:hypothetical protein
MADPQSVAKKDGKAFRTHRVAVECFVASDYELERLEEQERGATGLLRVLWLRPRSAGSPGFVGRWDEKKNMLDFDAVDGDGDVDRTVEFDGHHSSSLPNRHFAVEIRFPKAGRLIFAGIVAFGLGRDLALEGSVKMNEEVTVEAVKLST